MSEFEKDLSFDNDNELERLLSHASPRAVPDEIANASVRRAVHDEWRKVTQQRQRRQHTMKFAIAASLVVVVFSIFTVFRPTGVDLVQVASIQKSFGSIYFLGAQSVLTPANSLTTIQQGQTIVTGEDAGLALAWDSGGSLRVDKNTEVEFQNDGSIFLHSGKVYFDSQPSDLIAGAKAADTATFVIATDRGHVTHIGTQFMTEVASDSLTVSVREGRVTVDGQYSDQTASRGEQIKFVGRLLPTRLSIKGYGGDWAWIGDTSPSIDATGKSIYAFLQWVQRETGFELRFMGDKSELHARRELLKGRIDFSPRKALELSMRTTSLDYEIDRERGIIYVNLSK